MGNPVVHWQMITRDPQALAAFYSSLCDWKVDDANALGYRTIDTGSKRGIGGGMWPAPPGAQPFVQLFIEVDDVKAHVERAVKLGGRVMVPPQLLPEGDELAILQDPEGIPFGLHRAGGA
jgi:predicted enzyme related to lactoylglutathione lyase